MTEYEDEGEESPLSEDEKKNGKDADDAILKASRDGLTERVEAEFEQRKAMADDLRFATLEQWPAEIRSARENDVVNGPRPCLTVDQINQFITQVSNDMRQNHPSIKTRPVDNVGDSETAKVFQGLIRHIEDRSSAPIAYQTAGDSTVTIGLGFVRVRADYIEPDSFDQELIIDRVPDTFAVYLGKHKMPDGSDADAGWILDKMPLANFKRDYPKAKCTSEDFDGMGESPEWNTEETITVCEYYYKQYTPATLLFLASGKTMFKDDYDKLPKADRPVIVSRRKTQKVSVKWCKHSAVEILERTDWPGQYIPIAEEVGKEKIVDGKRVLWGLVRPAKDSLRAFNYWISALTEKMALAPKAPFIGAVGQFATMGDQWDKANVNNYAKLEYDPIDVNGNMIPAPRRQEPMQMEPAMAAMLQMMQNNVKSSLGMYKAAIGEAESQQSGRAILALQKESDTGTLHFGDNQALMITHIGRILVDVIPKFYDTKRVLRILGEDDQPDTVSIDPAQKEPMRKVMGADGKIKKIYNLSVGKYDVTVSSGPGYQTSRQEAATVMTDLANTAKDPVSAAILRYGAVKNSDFAGSDEIVRMLKSMLPPQAITAEGEQEPIPAAAMAKISELTQQAEQMNAEGQKLMQENQQLKAGVQEGMAKVQADAQASQAKIQSDAQAAQMKIQADAQIEQMKIQANAELEQMKIASRQQEASEEIALKERTQKEELRLAREKAAAELVLKRDIAEAELEMDRQRMIQQNQNSVSEINLNHTRRTMEGGKEKSPSPDKSEANAQNAALIKALTATKKITMTRSDGTPLVAEVRTQ